MMSIKPEDLNNYWVTADSHLGHQISDDYASHSPLLLGILKGSVIFLSDLMRHISVPHEIDFLAISSYGKGG